METSKDIYSKIIHVDYDKHIQIRLTLNQFRGVEYLHIRKYYQDFDEEWLPSNEGISFPIDIENCQTLFEGMAEILSLAESKELIESYFGELIKDLYQR